MLHILLPIMNRFDQTESDISFFLTYYSFLGEGCATLVNTAHHIIFLQRLGLSAIMED